MIDLKTSMETLELVWFIASIVVKLVIYITYFIPLIGARILQFLGLWPTMWPFSPLL